jgi:hypothetical protein
MSICELRIPNLLHQHLSDIIKRNDTEFIQDAARLLGIPARDIRKQLFGTTGVVTPVLCETKPWWMGNQCVACECRNEALWIRCGAMAVENGVCFQHLRSSDSLLRYDAAELVDLPRRRPVEFEGETYWAAEGGDMLNSSGQVVPMTMNWKTGVLNIEFKNELL